MTRRLVTLAASLALAACDAEPSPPVGPVPPALSRVAVVVVSDTGSPGDLAGGLALEIGHRLSYAPDFVVRGGWRDAPEVADALDADHVVRLAVEPVGVRWAVRWALDPAQGDRLLADSADVGTEGLPALPRDVALTVVDALSADRRNRAALEAEPLPSSPEAYAAFLRLLGGRTQGGDARERLVRRISTLDSVVAALPDFPPAVLALGDAYLDLAGLVEGAGPYYDLAGRHLERAVELAPGFPPAREKLASYRTKLGRSEEAMALLAEGIAAHPAEAGFHDATGYLLRYAGFMRESIESYRKAQELDARLENQVSTQDQITKSFIYLGEYASALASHERVEALLDSLGEAPTEKEHLYKGVIHLLAGDLELAVASFQAGRAADPTTVWSMFGEGYEGIATGDRDRVRDVLGRLEAHDVIDGERHYRLVHLAAFLDEPERALRHLRVAIEGGFFAVPYFESDPLTEGLRPEPGFQDLVGKARARHEAFPRPGG